MLYAGSLAVLGLLFHLYAASPGCRLNSFFIAWTFVLGIFYTVLSVRPCPCNPLQNSSKNTGSGGQPCFKCLVLLCTGAVLARLAPWRPCHWSENQK